MNDLTFLDIHSAAKLIEKRELSPVELTAAYLDKIKKFDPIINSYISISADRAMTAARVAEAHIYQDNPCSVLNGIPIALKDLYETAGVATTAGSRFFAQHIPLQDAYTVGRLRSASAVLLGKLNMHEIALGVTNVNPHYGTCRNPWDLECISGGSSGGSAAALAAGFCMGSLGSDTGGSIRIPASLCGIVGFKPTYGRVSLRGVIPLSWNLDHSGPMARSVLDVAILLQAIAGYDPDDPYSVRIEIDDYLRHIQDGVAGWRIGIAVGEYFSMRTAPDVLEAVHQAAYVLESLGADITEVDFPEARIAARANGLMTTSDAAAYHQQRIVDKPDDFGLDVLSRLQQGAAYTSREYILARRTQSLLRHRFAAFFEKFDILLTPTTPITAPPIEGPDAVAQAPVLTRFTAPFNLTGLPAISVPCGFSAQHLPIGLQLVGAPWSEAKLLRAGYAYEQATGFHLIRPTFVDQ